MTDDPETIGLRSYRPANGTEGLLFQHRYCSRCIHDREYRRTQTGGCSIWASALFYQIGEPEYPPELVADGPIGGRCLAFAQDSEEPVFTSGDRPSFPLPSEIAAEFLAGKGDNDD